MNNDSNTQEHTCPFCGLLCTGIKVAVDGLRITPKDALPEPCRAAYLNAGLDALPAPQIQGREASLNDALERAANILKKARQPLFSGLAADFNTARAVVRLARDHHGIIDHINSARSGATRVMQNYGWVTSTLSEIAHRADLFVVLGKSTLEVNPRLAERLLERRSDDRAPRFIFVGAYTEDDIPTLLKPYAHEIIHMPDAALPDAIRYLNLLAHRGECAANDAAASHERDAALRQLYAAIGGAKYSCFVWYAATFGERHTDIPLLSLSRLIKCLNRKTRCVSFPLGNNHGDHTMHSVAMWHTGKPPCASFAGGADAHYNPAIFNTDELLARRRVDAVFWITPLTPSPPPRECGDAPLVTIGHAATPFDSPAEVFIPVGIPGVDYAGHLSRVDSVVALRLNPIRQSDLPSATDILNALGKQAA